MVRKWHVSFSAWKSDHDQEIIWNGGTCSRVPKKPRVATVCGPDGQSWLRSRIFPIDSAPKGPWRETDNEPCRMHPSPRSQVVFPRTPHTPAGPGTCLPGQGAKYITASRNSGTGVVQYLDTWFQQHQGFGDKQERLRKILSLTVLICRFLKSTKVHKKLQQLL